MGLELLGARISGAIEGNRSGEEAARLFAPGQAIWTVNRETALLLGAGRALLLQIAHPLVAAGVAEHSRFTEEPLGRLYRTLNPMYTMVFGTLPTARAAARGFEAAHRRVRGVLRERVGPFSGGTPYDAGDPVLRLWVHATLIDTSLLVYQGFVAPLSPTEQARYYHDSRQLGRLLGIAERLSPPTLEDFHSYFERMLASDVLTVGPTARALARHVFWPPRAPALALVGLLVRFVTAGLLPDRIREQYGYRWGPGRERALGAAAGAIRRALPTLPALLRVVPHARAAERRLRTGTPVAPAA